MYLTPSVASDLANALHRERLAKAQQLTRVERQPEEPRRAVPRVSLLSAFRRRDARALRS